MAPEQVKFEAFIRDDHLREVEFFLGELGINFYSIKSCRVHSSTGKLAPFPEMRRDPKDAYMHERQKLEVIVDGRNADEVRSLLHSIAESDGIAAIDELVTSYRLQAVEQQEPSYSTR